MGCRDLRRRLVKGPMIAFAASGDQVQAYLVGVVHHERPGAKEGKHVVVCEDLLQRGDFTVNHKCTENTNLVQPCVCDVVNQPPVCNVVNYTVRTP